MSVMATKQLDVMFSLLTMLVWFGSAGIMSTVRTVPVPELSDEQIQAARDRRRASAPKDDVTNAQELGGLQVPSNHPWATRKAVTPAEEEAKRQAVMKANQPRRGDGNTIQ